MSPTTAYLIDTSYLLELYAIPGKSTPEAIIEVRERLRSAAERGSPLYVTVPSIYELAKHIVRIRDGNQRRRYAVHVKNDVLSSLEKGTPWSVIPSRQLDALGQLVSSFIDNHIHEGIDLTDSTLIDEARRLRRERYKGSGWRVHIWTTDGNLKAREPDREQNAYLGLSKYYIKDAPMIIDGASLMR